MSQDGVTRRLAAILAADVVGYGRLMGADEAGTLARIKTLRREVIDPSIATHGGSIFKTTGDGVLVEFPSAVNAVEHAVEVQHEMAARNAGLPDDRRIEFRIGINVGDVIAEDGDIFGDGVNIAARLEALSETGGVRIAGNVYDQVKNKTECAFEDMGLQQVKNIEDPVHTYRVILQGSEAAIGSDATAAAVLSRPALAVLPFTNLSGDPEQEYFADGLTEDIITALCAWRAFPVIARNSSFIYKGKSVKVQQVAEELGVRYVIEGSVRKSGERVRVTAQLIDAKTGHHVWAERYDRELADIFELQDEITRRIAAIVAPELEKAERRRSVTKRTENLDAWECCRRGMAVLGEFTKPAIEQARGMFTRSIALDPNYSQAYTGLAYTHHRDIYLGNTEDRAESISKLCAAAERAVALDGADSLAHWTLGMANVWSGRLDHALAEQERAVALNPSDVTALSGLGGALILAGRADDAIPHIENALRLNPRDPRIHLFYAICARAHLDARHYDAAVDWARKSIQVKTPALDEQLILAAALGHLDRPAEARAVLEAAGIGSDGSVADITFSPLWQQYREPDANDHMLDGLRKAGFAE